MPWLGNGRVDTIYRIMLRSLILIISIIGAYCLLRGWGGAPALLLRSSLAVAVLVAGLAVWGIRRGPECWRMISLRKANWMDYLSLGAAVVLAEAFFVVLTSTLLSPSQEVATVLHELVTDDEKPSFDEEVGESEDVNGDVNFGSSQSGNWLFKPNLERDLPKKSNHKLSNKPEVFVQLDRSEDAEGLLNSRIHLRAFAFSRFDGLSWSALPMPRINHVAPITFSAVPNRPLIPHRVFHAVNPTGQNVFTSLSGATTTDLTQLTQLSKAIYILPHLSKETDGYQYRAQSSPVHLTDLINEIITPAQGREEELALPQALSSHLHQTAEVFKHEPDLVSQLVALQSFLQDNYKYSLKTSNVSNENPLRNFLYSEKKGYCEHFATAAAVLCRTIGVPSRIAYGWSGGRLYKEKNMFVFRGNDAHAWTEIKLKGYGWVVFDTTPPDDEATPETQSAPASEAAPNPQEVIAEQQKEQERLALQETTVNLGGDPTPLLVALAVVAFCCGGFLLMRFHRRPETAPDGRPLKLPPPAYLGHFKQTCAVLGRPMPVGRTLRQHVDMIQSEGDAPQFLSDLLVYHYGLLYGDVVKDKAREKNLNRAMKSWRKEGLTARRSTKVASSKEVSTR